jgi:triacylglycerol esterase/lipase EstA (alpha/beta hydrolase family)
MTLAALASASVVGAGPAAAAHSQLPRHDPAYDVPRVALAAALRCPAHLRKGREAVLLVHGTGLTPEESWGWNYAKLLPPAGYDVCTVALPNRAMTDIQVSAEYVAFAIDDVAAKTHHAIAVITHSQGGMEARWAVRWWRTARANVDDLVLLASPNHGIAAADACADSDNCWPAVWQMTSGAHFIHALNSVDETPGAVSVTNLYSRSDELVEPSSTVPLAGNHVSNVAVQDLCPHVVHHAGMLHDAAVFALVLDALRHRGPADPRRVPTSVCVNPWADGLTAADVVGGNAILYADAASQGFAGAAGVASEPTLKGYARRFG